MLCMENICSNLSDWMVCKRETQCCLLHQEIYDTLFFLSHLTSHADSRPLMQQDSVVADRQMSLWSYQMKKCHFLMPPLSPGLGQQHSLIGQKMKSMTQELWVWCHPSPWNHLENKRTNTSCPVQETGSPVRVLNRRPWHVMLGGKIQLSYWLTYPRTKKSTISPEQEASASCMHPLVHPCKLTFLHLCSPYVLPGVIPSPHLSRWS